MLKKFLNKSLIIISLSAVFLSACGSTETEAEAKELLTPPPEEELQRFELPNGRTVKEDATHMSVPGLLSQDLEEFCRILDSMPNLNYVNLGNEDPEESSLTPEDVYYLIENYPQIKFDYVFNVFGREISLDDDYLDLNHLQMDDNGKKLEGVLKCLRSLSYLDMDFCGVDNSVMERIRSEYPEAEVEWRIWFGENYSVRTDCERILASNPDLEVLSGNDLEVLKYCTKVKYLDIGHNEITDVSFLAYMPELYACIISINPWVDLSPISACTKLDYLEINDSSCQDLSPLASCTSLKHLNLCNLGEVTGWDALLNLDSPERIRIGIYTKIDDESLAALKSAFPDCDINTEAADSDLSDWRWITDPIRQPRYDQLFDEMGYNHYSSALSYYWNDPDYYPEGYVLIGESYPKYPEW